MATSLCLTKLVLEWPSSGMQLVEKEFYHNIEHIRVILAYADFHTLAAITVYIAFLPSDFKRKYVVCHIVLIWLVALVTASLPLSGNLKILDFLEIFN